MYKKKKTKNKKVIKDDITFLEYPNWIVGEREKIDEVIIEKEHGTYKLTTSAESLPDRFDKIVLYYFLSTLFKDSQLQSTQIKTTRYRAAKDIYFQTKNVGKTHYDRIMLALKRWTGVFIEFEGVFYDGDGYTKRYFHIIDSVTLNEETKELSIQFNDEYITQLRETACYKLIDFDEYKLLRRPVSSRLYEILIKTFKDRDQWQIGIVKLGEKLTLEKLYPSQIFEKLIPAINEINKNTSLKVHLDYNKQTHLCTFTKVKPADKDSSPDTPQQQEPPVQDERFTALIQLLPEEHQGKKTLSDTLEGVYKRRGFDYAARNIRYANKHCNGNYRAYLAKALEEDWGLAMEEDEKRKQKLREEQERQRQKKREEARRKKELDRKVKEHIKNLSPDELGALKEEVLSQLDDKTKEDAEKFNFLEGILKAGIEEMVRKRLSDG